MSKKVREEMLPRLRQRYAGRARQGRSRMIDELCEQFGYERKHAIKLLNARAGWGGDPARAKGRPTKYGEEVRRVLWELWEASEQPCGKRMAALVSQWLPYYERRRGKLAARVRRAVLSISAAQIDRVLAPRKAATARRGRCATKPGGLLKRQIEMRTDNWQIDRPGYLEADTVAHCGQSLEGDFIWSVTYTDVHSGWTQDRAVWNRGQHGVLEATREVEEGLPFELLGFDCDNGGEFLNWHLHDYLRKRPRPVAFTRSRPYHKDDNGHVEQKNWMRVRQLLGYARLDDPGLVAELNALYAQVWDPLHNFFLPSAKLVHRVRQGAKIRRRHDAPKTPCERLLESPHVDAASKRRLRAERRALDPFDLRERLERGLRRVLHRALHSSRPTGSLRCAPGEAKSKHVSVS